MQRQDRLREIGRQFYAAKEKEKISSTEVKELREEFFRLYNEEFKHKDHLLPVKTVEVPDEFWTSTGMNKDEFVESRFPGWLVEHVERNVSTNNTTFVLRKDPKYIAGTIDIDDTDKTIRISKEVSEYTPEIDWKTLKEERPDLFDKLAQPITSYEIDEGAWDSMVSETPEELATIQRHMNVRSPVLRATAKRIKDARKDQ